MINLHDTTNKLNYEQFTLRYLQFLETFPPAINLAFRSLNIVKCLEGIRAKYHEEVFECKTNKFLEKHRIFLRNFRC